MQVLNVRRIPSGETQGVRQVAQFDVQLTPECRILGCRLMRAPDGSHFVYGPMGRQGRVVTFGHDLAVKMTREAVSANDNRRNHAV